MLLSILAMIQVIRWENLHRKHPETLAQLPSIIGISGSDFPNKTNPLNDLSRVASVVFPRVDCA
jgi:hypothetical protein